MYRVSLSDFEGPLDLLLFFIKRDELDIYDIPIAKITKDFLEYLQYLQQLDLDIAGEFIVTAATLMQIKVQMLLPKQEGTEEEEIDPRAELVKRLLEYKRYKEMALKMDTMQRAQARVYYRGNFEHDPKSSIADEEENLLRDVTLFDLIAAFKYTVDRMPRKHVHEINKLNVTIEEQLTFLIGYLDVKKESTFYEIALLLAEKIRIVVTFLALLELIRQKKVFIRQAESYADITIVRAPEESV
ncbi:MAG TPA: segregation/condensation protein A [Bacteroidota bacterium]|nr:segregation/condensation protein A [Bacteroidota bacterium]